MQNLWRDALDSYQDTPVLREGLTPDSVPNGRPSLALCVNAHRDFLFRLAMLQMRNTTDAEDLVQETLLAGLRQIETFSGTASLKSWLAGILRHKITDALRYRIRHVPLDESLYTASVDEFDVLFTEDGTWRPEHVGHWDTPDSTLARKQFVEILEICLDSLPEGLSRIFMMREYLELGFDEMSPLLHLTQGNIRVQLYRARMRLRDCVNRGWQSPSDTKQVTL